MTAIAFPMTDAMRVRHAAREDAVDAARAIIRGKERHGPEALRLACEALMTYGTPWDFADAYHVQRALDRAERRA